MMTKTIRGWWNLGIANVEGTVDPSDESTLEHIANMIKKGFTEGEIIQETEDETREIIAECVDCDKVFHLEVLKTEYDSWNRGTKIQLAFPNMPAGDRELLISGTCGKCFDKQFKETE
jgi:hypothetical protein